jgi:hypothetical protein
VSIVPLSLLSGGTGTIKTAALHLTGVHSGHIFGAVLVSTISNKDDWDGRILSPGGAAAQTNTWVSCWFQSGGNLGVGCRCGQAQSQCDGGTWIGCNFIGLPLALLAVLIGPAIILTPLIIVFLAANRKRCFQAAALSAAGT